LSILYSTKEKEIAHLYDINIDKLKLNLSIISNKNLFDSFKKTFFRLTGYKGPNPIKDQHLLDIRKTYIDEFRHRLFRAGQSELTEIEDMIKAELKKDVGSQHTANLLMLESMVLKVIKARGISRQELKKRWL
jgi:hypothetical protein